jgi:hypothetical protein
VQKRKEEVSSRLLPPMPMRRAVPLTHFSQRGVDFSQLPLHAIFVIHDAGLDWALATQVITELLCSDGGRMGTRRKRQFGVYDGRDVPVVLTNPDFIWGT